jgi:hypothetical protein
MADNKLMLKINFQQQYKTIAFDPDSTVAQAIVFIRQKLALSEGPQVAQLGLFLGSEGDEKPAGGVGPGNIPGMFLADDATLRLSGVHAKVCVLAVVCSLLSGNRVCGASIRICDGWLFSRSRCHRFSRISS